MGICPDCGMPAQFNCIRCSSCRVTRKRQMARERQYRRSHGHIRPGGHWRVVHDPDHSWTKDTAFPLEHIELMVKDGNLTPGTILERDGKRIRIIRKGRRRLGMEWL